VLALVAPALAWSPLSLADLDLALLLVSLSVTYSLCVVGWEKARRLLLLEHSPAMQPNVLAVWCFASAIMLPPTAAAAVTAASAVGGWRAYNAAGTNLQYRYVYSTMTSVLAATVASTVFRQDLPLVGSLSMAAAAWLTIAIAATTLAMCASGQFDAIK